LRILKKNQNGNKKESVFLVSQGIRLDLQTGKSYKNRFFSRQDFRMAKGRENIPAFGGKK
jgi:hypothetical protein